MLSKRNQFENVKKLVEPYVNLPLECDGLTRVLTYVLTKNKVPHKVMSGYVEVTDPTGKKNVFDPHMWIDLGNENVVDYRLRMWFGNYPYVPHGVFSLKDKQNVKYHGHSVTLPVSDFIFKVLTGEI